MTALGAHHHVLGTFDFPRDDQKPADLQRLGVDVPERAGLRAHHRVWGATSTSRSSGEGSSTPGTGRRSSRSRSAGSSRCRWAPSPARTVRWGCSGPGPCCASTTAIIVTQPVLDYRPLAPGYPQGRREMPLRTIELRTLETPKIDLPISFTEEVTQEQIDHSLDQPALDHGVRPAGRRSTSTASTARAVGSACTKPMLFIPYSFVGNTDGVVSTFNGASPTSRTADVRAQQARPHRGRSRAKPDATTAPTEYLQLRPGQGRRQRRHAARLHPGVAPPGGHRRGPPASGGAAHRGAAGRRGPAVDHLPGPRVRPGGEPGEPVRDLPRGRVRGRCRRAAAGSPPRP